MNNFEGKLILPLNGEKDWKTDEKLTSNKKGTRKHECGSAKLTGKLPILPSIFVFAHLAMKMGKI